MKTYPTKLARSDWENENWINHGNHEIRWNIVTDGGISIEVPSYDIEKMNDGEQILFNVGSFFHQFSSPITIYRLSVKPIKHRSAPDGDINTHGSIRLIRRGYKLIAENVNCCI